MSQHALAGAQHPRLSMPLRGRDPTEDGRAATPLELFFDLVAVVAVALAAEHLHHAYLDGFGLQTLISYAMVFFAVWWAWANFSWFASAYDTDDVVFRVGVFVVMTGALVLAAGVPQAFDDQDFTLAVIGYVIMRIALVVQWIRVSFDDPQRAATARRFAIGITLCQIGWLAIVAAPQLWPVVWLLFFPAELLVPAWAQQRGRLPFHPEHITERYGLFMIIVLGESVLAASLAIQSALGVGTAWVDLLAVIIGGLLVVYSMWWIYFDRPEEHLLDSPRAAQAWNYLHLLIFGAVAAVGAGLVVAIEEASGHAHLGWSIVGLTVAVPLALYLAGLWLLYLRLPIGRLHRAIVPATAALVVIGAFVPAPILVMGLTLSGMIAVKVWLRVRRPSHSETPGEVV